MAFWAAIPAIASIAGGLLGKSKKEGDTVNIDQLMPSFQRETGQKLAKWIQQYMYQYKPGEAYTGKFSAGMTPQENAGLSLLDQFLSGTSIGDLFKAGKQQISDTLAGKYADPNTSPFIKAMKTVSEQDLQDAINASRRGSGARGKFFSTASLGEEGDLENRNLQNLNSIIGNFVQNERNNMLNSVPIANAMDQYETTTAPLAKIQASQTSGSLSRTLEQVDLERQYNDFIRRRSEMAQPISAAQSMYGTQSQYGIPTWQMPNTQTTNTFGNIMSILDGMNFSGLNGTGDIWSKIGSLFNKG